MKDKNIKKVLVLGGAGYIGSVLSTNLIQSGYDVKVIDNCWFGNQIGNNVEVAQSDIFNLQQTDLVNYHTVIFLAGLSNDPMADYSPKDNFIYNTGMPAYIGYLAREAGVKRMIFASSCSVYGYTHNRTYEESDITISNFPYGVSKLQGEQALLSLTDENFSVVCFRQGTVSGYSPRMRLDLAVNTMFKNALQQEVINLSSAKIWRPILGLVDLCNAYRLAIESDLSGGHIINISSFNTTIGDLANRVSRYVFDNYKKHVTIQDNNIHDYRNYKVSIHKAQQLIGYQPSQDTISILDDLSLNLESFKDFDNENYYNIAIFKKIMEKELREVSCSE